MTAATACLTLLLMKKRFVGPLVIGLLVLLWVAVVSCAGLEGRAIAFPSGKIIHAEVADTPAARNRGLMFREGLPEDGGMLFVFQKAGPYRFWMKNCKFSIDIIWLNERKEIVFVSENTPPCKIDPCPTYGPDKEKSLFVIEVASGFVKKEALKLGMAVRF
ncbi:MAG: DUF192 domain-containing protein [Nitrospiria bacterium]